MVARAELPKTVDRRTLSAHLGISAKRIDQLVKEGFITKVGKGAYPFSESVQGYGRSMKATIEGQTKNVSANRAQNARAAEIELRMAREDRKIIDLTEAVAALDRVAGDFLQTVGGLPARITRDPRERQRIEAICDAERLRLSDHFAQSAQALRSGLPPDQADDEDDA